MSEVIAEHKIGKNKGRPRIWLDGKRLTAAGFTGGTVYHSVVYAEDNRILCTTATGFPNVCPCQVRIIREADRHRLRKVTGRPDGKPIIDILGADVETAFPGAERVKVTFTPGRIVIERAS